jgi:hypothetical protein
MENPKKCEHPACRCNAREGSDYCSTFCEGEADTADIVCSCGHELCGDPEMR